MVLQMVLCQPVNQSVDDQMMMNLVCGLEMDLSPIVNHHLDDEEGALRMGSGRELVLFLDLDLAVS